MDSKENDRLARGIVQALAVVVERMIQPLDSMPDAYLSRTKFEAFRAPGISVRDYLLRIQRYASCSAECFVLALVYIDRLHHIKGLVLTELNVHRVLITSVVLAAKFFDDHYFNNAYYAKVGGVPCSEMNELEIEYLIMVNFTLHVSTDTYERYYNELLASSYDSSVDRLLRHCVVMDPEQEGQLIYVKKADPEELPQAAPIHYQQLQHYPQEAEAPYASQTSDPFATGASAYYPRGSHQAQQYQPHAQQHAHHVPTQEASRPPYHEDDQAHTPHHHQVAHHHEAHHHFPARTQHDVPVQGQVVADPYNVPQQYAAHQPYNTHHHQAPKYQAHFHNHHSTYYDYTHRADAASRSADERARGRSTNAYAPAVHTTHHHRAGYTGYAPGYDYDKRTSGAINNVAEKVVASTVTGSSGGIVYSNSSRKSGQKRRQSVALGVNA